MKRFILLISLCILSLDTIWAQPSCISTSCMPKQAHEDCTVMETNGCIDWTNGIIYAVGMGVPNPNLKTKAQRSYSAYRAAMITAMRNLLQMVEGINITSNTTVKMGMLEDDTIHAQVQGKIQHVQEAGKPKYMNDGSVFVTMKMYMRDIVAILINNNQFVLQEESRDKGKEAAVPEQKPKQPTEPTYGGSENAIYTGLIIDASETGISPAMSPKIYDEKGKEVYGSVAVDRDFALQHGIVGYTKELKDARQNKRVKGNPMLIKAKISPGKTSDLVISDKDAKILRKLEATQTFLREARVLIIIG